MKKSPLVAFFLIFCLFGLLAAGALLKKQVVDNHAAPSSYLNASKFHLPPEIYLRILMKYPDGQVKLPLDAADKALVDKYLGADGYIIQFRGQPTGISSVVSQAASLKSVDERSSNKKGLKGLKAGSGSKIRREFFNVFNGVSMRKVSEEEIAEISNLDAVEKIYPLKKYHTLLAQSVPQIGATDTWGMQDAAGMNITGKGVDIAIIDTGIDYTHGDIGNCSLAKIIYEYANHTVETPYSLESDHPYGNDVDRNWTITQPGYKNIAVHFAVIDTEDTWDVLYLEDAEGRVVAHYSGHIEDVWSPSVRGDTIKLRLVTDYEVSGWGFSIDRIANESSPSFNCSKVVAGYDYVNEDADPMDDYGHGTHCAGIAAGNGVLKGVAPDANIMAYKVCDSGGSCPDDDIIAAIDRAIVDGADVISMSLGGYGDPDDALSQAVDNAVDSGVVVVVAAGNEGPYNGTIDSPGCARKAFTIGAMYKENGSVESNLLVLGSEGRDIASAPLRRSATTPAGGLASELRYARLGLSEDFADGTFTGKIALIQRSSVISFTDQVRNAYAGGCAGVVIYNNKPLDSWEGDISQWSLENQSSIPVIAVSKEDGEYLLSLLDNGSVRVNMSVAASPDVIAEFSSRGPSSFYNKPDILAPGVDVCSAGASYLLAEATTCIDDKHIYLSGTSMATPHVAGAAALLLQKNPHWTPMQIKAAFKNTAHDYGYYPIWQGAGMINVSAAIKLNSPPPVAFITNISDVRFRDMKS